jgi:hypothetical protein
MPCAATSPPNGNVIDEKNALSRIGTSRSLVDRRMNATARALRGISLTVASIQIALKILIRV